MFFGENNLEIDNKGPKSQTDPYGVFCGHLRCFACPQVLKSSLLWFDEDLPWNSISNFSIKHKLHLKDFV